MLFTHVDIGDKGYFTGHCMTRELWMKTGHASVVLLEGAEEGIILDRISSEAKVDLVERKNPLDHKLSDHKASKAFCPYCGSKHSTTTTSSDNYWHCTDCNRDFLTQPLVNKPENYIVFCENNCAVVTATSEEEALETVESWDYIPKLAISANNCLKLLHKE